MSVRRRTWLLAAVLWWHEEDKDGVRIPWRHRYVLEKHGLIEVDEELDLWTLTARGEQVMQALDILVEDPRRVA